MTTFRASAQYNDWIGTSAADNADKNSIHDYLRGKKLVTENEFPVGIEVFIGENHGGKVKPPYIHVLVIDKSDYETAAAALGKPDPLHLRKVDIEITLEEFIGLFKRFSVALSPRGINITGREYNA